MATRKGIRKADETALPIQCRRRCCLCYWLGGNKETKPGQIAHIDQNASNSELKNLVWLCLVHHNEYDSKTSQSKGITKGEVIQYKEKLESLYAHEIPTSSDEPLVLIDSFPKGNQSIKVTELSDFFLKFNKPVDRESARVIRNHYMRLNSEAQWTTGGWIQYKEDDAKLVWHPHSEEIERIKAEAQKTRTDEHTFEILIGTNKGNRVKGKDGSVIEPVLMEVVVEIGIESKQARASTNELSRAEMIKIAIVEIDGLTGYIPPTTPTFYDVQSSDWYYDYVESAVQLGIISGYADDAGNLTGSFGPEDIASRGWVTKVLVYSFAIPTTLTPSSPFTDVTPSHSYHEHILTTYNQSVIDGLSDNNFHPDDPLTWEIMIEWLTKAKNPVLRENF